MFRRILSALVALTLIIGMSALAVTPADYSVDTPENLVPEHLYGRGFRDSQRPTLRNTEITVQKR